MTCFLRKQPENMLPFCRAKPWQTDYVFSRNTDKEKDNVFPWETVGIKINFFCLFPWKTIKETGFLFRIQTDGIILLCFLFVCVGNGLSVFQANTNFTRFPRLFSWKTVTIPSSVNTYYPYRRINIRMETLLTRPSSTTITSIWQGPTFTAQYEF